MTPQEYVQEKAAASGSSFYYAFLFLPKPRRAAITAFYAFCREVDDVVDDVSDSGVARTKLAWWQLEVAKSFSGEATHPVMKALMPCVSAFGIEQAHLQAVIEGCRMDLEQTRYLDFPALQRYCHLVAGVVGEVSARIFGQADPRTTEYAHTLGLAFQLTNIIRDVGEDMRRQRIYLPLDEVERHGVTIADITAARETDNFRKLMEFQIERALGIYRQAYAALPAVDRKAQRVGLVMAAIYRTLLQEVQSDGCRVLTRHTSLTPLRKLWIAWTTWIRG
jgi:phytoene synthase